MIGYLIRMDGDGLPLYFDPAAAKSVGGHALQGWTQNKKQALAFATAYDAQKFIDGLLPRVAEAKPEAAALDDRHG